MSDSPANIANMTGFPDLIVPAGITKDGLPVAISFFGTAYTEPKLIGYAYDFEQATHARVLPKNTPLLAGDTLARRGSSSELLWTRADGSGTPQRLLQQEGIWYPYSFTADGKRLCRHRAIAACNRP